jgi:hypothetical protein
VQIPLASPPNPFLHRAHRPRSGRWHYARAGVAASSTILGRDRIFNSPITCGHYFRLSEVNDGSVIAKSANKVSDNRSTPPSVAARIIREFAIPTRSDPQKPGERAPRHVNAAESGSRGYLLGPISVARTDGAPPPRTSEARTEMASTTLSGKYAFEVSHTHRHPFWEVFNRQFRYEMLHNPDLQLPDRHVSDPVWRAKRLPVAVHLAVARTTPARVRQLLDSGHPSLTGITLEKLKAHGWMRLNYPDPLSYLSPGPFQPGPVNWNSSRIEWRSADWIQSLATRPRMRCRSAVRPWPANTRSPSSHQPIATS